MVKQPCRKIISKCGKLDLIHSFLAALFFIFYSPAIGEGIPPGEGKAVSFRVYSDSEMEKIIDRVRDAESGPGGFSGAFNEEEGAVGIMQIRQIALTEYNLWNGTNIILSQLKDPVTCRMVGKWLIGTRYHHFMWPGNIVMAVASFNAGPWWVANGWYPADYLEFCVPWYWQRFKTKYIVVQQYRNKFGKLQVQLIDAKTRKYPTAGQND